MPVHRWNLPEGADPPEPDDLIRGASPRHSWRVLEVIPIDSPVHPNAWRLRLERLGPWTWPEVAAGRFQWHYPNAAEREREARTRQGPAT